jgi:phage N-6-adenine-methyltransferase
VTVAHNHRAQGTGQNEWYTPERYIEFARAVLGVIDLDPASSEIAQAKVRATRYFTIATDGLIHDWHGRVWLNPPYGQPYITQFVGKLVGEYTALRVSEAILLTHNYTDTAWFHMAASACSAICFTRGRIRFVAPSGEVASPTQGQAFFYFGPHPGRFRTYFGPEGHVFGAAA